MPAPFRVRDADRPGVDLGEWDESGGITIPGTLSAGGITGAGGQVVFAAMVAAFAATASTSTVISAKVLGDANPRFSIDASGLISWGDGTAAVDTNLYRVPAGGELKTDDNLTVTGFLAAGSGQSAGNFTVFGNALVIGSAGGGLQVKEGTNASMGANNLVGGTVVVATTEVTANSRIFLTNQLPGGTAGFLVVSARTAGVSFTILSSSGTDTSRIGWLIVEPAP